MLFFCGEDKHRASPLCLLCPRVGPHLTFARCPHPMLLVGVGWPRTAPFPQPPLLCRAETRTKEDPAFLQLM